MLALCHLRNTGFTDAADEDLMAWASKLARARATVMTLERDDFSFTPTVMRAYPALQQLDTANAGKVPDATSLDLSVREMVLLRFGVIKDINALAAACLTLIDSSMSELPWTLAHLLKKFGHLLFNDTKVMGDALRPVVLYRPVSCRVVSCRVVSCRVVSCRVVSCRVVSCRVVSCRVVSCSVVSCRVVSCRVVSCRVVSCRVVSCRVVSCRVVSCRVVSCCVVSCLYFVVATLTVLVVSGWH
jgi:hypothetical protein